MTIETFVNATEDFLKSLSYIGDLDSATLTAFRTAARELDSEFRTTLLTEYRRQLDAIKALAPVGEEESVDPLLMPES